MKCLSCNEEISEDSDTCVNCGWSYKENAAEAHQDEDNSNLVCVGCLKPYSPDEHYCKNCGATVGKFTRYLPFESIKVKSIIPSVKNKNAPHTIFSRLFSMCLYGFLIVITYIIVRAILYKL